MVVFLPKSIDGLGDLEAALTPEALEAVWPKLKRPEEIQISLPRFRLRTSQGLKPALEALGISRAFDSAGRLLGHQRQDERPLRPRRNARHLSSMSMRRGSRPRPPRNSSASTHSARKAAGRRHRPPVLLPDPRHPLGLHRLRGTRRQSDRDAQAVNARVSSRDRQSISARTSALACFFVRMYSIRPGSKSIPCRPRFEADGSHDP